MKKTVLAFMLVLVFALTACSGQNVAQNTGNVSSESLIMLDEGVWPVNEYTDGLPVAPGTVSWAALDTVNGFCGINLVDMTDDEYNAYMELLQENGYSVIEDVSEEIKGQNYVSIGTILSDGERGLSISHTTNGLSIYISFTSE
ncbi:MAG: hypothetical protein LUI10_13685 [Lachnospiraceae bacterium]|nr:hypothetical protein [Lachnospiraceae bacterium]